MFRLACLIIGCVLGCLPLPSLPIKEGAPGSGRLALYQKFRPILSEVTVTAAACGLCRLLFRHTGAVTVLWAGLGVLLGRLSPLCHEEGTAAVCAFEIFFAPVWGVLCCAAGVGVSVLTGIEVLGALLPSALFILPADLFYGAEAGGVALIAALLLAARHWQELSLLIEGEDTGEEDEDK